jgi:CubicO group peptidase (beta-lactamase class C family)
MMVCRGFDKMQSIESFSMRIFLLFCLFLAGSIIHTGKPAYAENPRKGLVQTVPESIGLLGTHLKYIDDAVSASMAAGETPGAVVLVARHGQIAYLKAFGNRSVQPSTEPMTVDTIFDMSSLTKVMATVPSVMLLVEQGSLRIEDKVKRYLPNFTGGGKDAITVRQLLTHYSGGARRALEGEYRVRTREGICLQRSQLYRSRRNREFHFGEAA